MSMVFCVSSSHYRGRVRSLSTAASTFPPVRVNSSILACRLLNPIISSCSSCEANCVAASGAGVTLAPARTPPPAPGIPPAPARPVLLLLSIVSFAFIKNELKLFQMLNKSKQLSSPHLLHHLLHVRVHAGAKTLKKARRIASQCLVALLDLNLAFTSLVECKMK